MPQKLEAHPLYDHQNDHFRRPLDCPNQLCIRINRDPMVCFKCPEGWKDTAAAEVPPSRPGWGGRRSGAGAPKGSFNHLKTGSRSALIRHAVEVLAEHKELRPFLLLLARAAIEGEIPQTTRRLILATLGEKTAGMQAATIQLRRLRDGKTAR